MIRLTQTPPARAIAWAALGLMMTGLSSAQADEAFVPLFRDLTLPNGLVLDRASDRTTVSSASTGLVSYAKVVATHRGQMSAEEVYPQVRQAFETTIQTNPDRNRGWLYHFTDPTGQPKAYTEVSTIDTAIFYASFFRAAELMGDQNFLAMIRETFAKIDVAFMMDGPHFLHGFHWVGDQMQVIPWKWEDSDEGRILYTLFDKPVELRRRIDLPLFVYFYPLVFEDAAEQVNLLRDAVRYQKEAFAFIGVTASDGPRGYQAGDPTVFSPLAVYAASPFSDTARSELDRLPHSKTTPAFAEGWVAEDKIGIDFAATYILTDERRDRVRLAARPGHGA